MIIFPLLTFIFLWNDGAKIELKQEPNDSEQVYELVGSGFQPLEELSSVSYSAGEMNQTTFKASLDGTFRELIFPEVLGLSEGNAIISIKRRSFNEIGRIDYKWKSYVDEESNETVYGKIWLSPISLKDSLDQAPFLIWALLYSSDFEPGKCFNLKSRDFNNEGWEDEVIADENGKLVRNNVRLEETLCHFIGYVNGAKHRFILEPKEGGKQQIFVTYLRPLTYRWNDDASVFLVPINIATTSFELTGKGFKSHEKIYLKTNNFDAPQLISSNAQGCFKQKINGTVNKNGGRETLEIKRENFQELGIIHYLWGEEAHDEVRPPKHAPSYD